MPVVYRIDAGLRVVSNKYMIKPLALLPLVDTIVVVLSTSHPR
jgi:hypothetical protein